MEKRELEIVDRLNTIADILKVNSSELISVKFNPLMPSESETVFGKFSTAYQYLSEYVAGLEKVRVAKLEEIALHRIGRSVKHPMPWAENEKIVFTIKDKNTKDIYWIQHETGLEIIGPVADIVGVVWTLIEIYTAIRKKIKDNKQDENSDRYFKQVSKTVITKRTFDKNGKLKEQIIEEMEVTNEGFGLSKEEFTKRLSD